MHLASTLAPRLLQLLTSVLLAGLLAGCGGGSSPSSSGSKNGVEPTPADTRDETLSSVREKLYTRADLASCQGAVRQLNVFLSANPDEKRATRDDREKLGFTPEEWVEVNSFTFTPLDAHYLEQCFLLRDAAQSLHVEALSPAKRAELAFAWVVRQVRLGQRKGEVLPPSYVLRRGWGSPEQRTQVFLALLRQLGIDGCVVIVPGKEPVTLAGALVGKDLLLFDSRLGLPLPGPTAGTVLTLAQLRAQPEHLKSLSADDKHTYDLTVEAVAKSEVGLVFELSAVAPRMQRLQQLLQPRVKVVLAADVAGEEKKFQEALKENGIAVKVATRPDQTEAPARALRVFLPQEDGGVDTPHIIDLGVVPGFALRDAGLQSRWTRLELYRKESIPWLYLPPPIRALPANSQLGNTARNLFAARYVEVLARAEEQKPQELEEETPFGGSDVQETRRKTISEDDLPRSMVLRGQTTKAREQLLRVLDTLADQRGIRRRVPDLNKRVVDWLSRAAEVYARLAQEREEVARGRGNPETQKLVTLQLAGLWAESPPPLPLLCAEALNPPLSAEATFLVALANHENAERLQARAGNATSPKVDEAWQAAADGWYTFLKYHGTHPNSSAAQRMHARALECSGKPEAARTIWENLASGTFDNKFAPLSDLEKTACLIRAGQLKK